MNNAALYWAISLYSAATALFSIYTRYHRPIWYAIAKPMPLLGLVAFFSITGFTEPGLSGGIFAGPLHFYHLFIIGLCLGLVGDFLLLKHSWFVPGLSSFLLGHVFYSLAYNTVPWGTPIWVQAILALTAIIYGTLFTRQLRKGGRTGYFFPVWIYLMVITTMVASAISFDVSIGRAFALQAAGAVLFWISDGLLAWNRMIRPFVQAQFWILGTYYTGQTLMTIGAINALRG